MKILVTGSCGFIGFSFIKHALKINPSIKIIGIDNINNYYSIRLKKDRMKQLLKMKNFSFYKVDLCENKKLNKIFKTNKIDCIYHFAAQAGVRYSIEHPRKYIDSNIMGYFNILEIVKTFKIKKLIYASSSSVYGEQTKFPLKEKLTLEPKNTYALSKLFDEKLSEIYANTYNLKIIGLRFFTVFGEWGRPDMFMMKYLNSIFFNKKFELYNYGNHFRDFTYIGDVVNILYKLLKKTNKKNHLVCNICSNKPIKITKVINMINSLVKKRAVIKLLPMQRADVKKTHGNNTLIKKLLNIKKFENISLSLKKTVDWYKKYYIKF
jgi:UDP-glucuronate 4-epimerase